MASTSIEIIEALVEALPIKPDADSRQGEFRANVSGQLRGALGVALGDPRLAETFPTNGYETVKTAISAFANSTRFDPRHRDLIDQQLAPVVDLFEQIARNNFVVARQGIVRSTARKLLNFGRKMFQRRPVISHK